MANLKTSLIRKLQKALAQRFPSPAVVKLEDHDGIIGVVRSQKFAGMETIDRQQLIRDVLTNSLTQEERQRVQVIVAVTPDEETGYMADDE